MKVLENETKIALEPIRLNPHYVLWYRNITVLIVSLIIPLTLLAYWNFNTLSVIIRRRRLRNRPSIDCNVNLVHQEGSLGNIENATGACLVTASAAAQALNSGLDQIISIRSVTKVDQSKIVGFNQ